MILFFSSYQSYSFGFMSSSSVLTMELPNAVEVAVSSSYLGLLDFELIWSLLAEFLEEGISGFSSFFLI